MPSSLLVLGGGHFALPLLGWAREAGLETLLIDSNPRAGARRGAHSFQAIPADDAAAHVALARRMAEEARARGGRLAVLVAEPRLAALLPQISEVVPGALPRRAGLQRALVGEHARSFLAERGFAVDVAGDAALELFAFFRDGAFVPAGSAHRTRLASGDVQSLQPSPLAPARLRAAFVLFERAARALALECGPLQATLVENGTGFALSGIAPGFSDLLGASHVARLAYGKSPLQAWFAHLAGAGGPFDEPATAARAAAGWLAVAPPSSGIFAGVDHCARARTLPGIAELWVEEPGRTLGAIGDAGRPLAHLVATGESPEAVESRLAAARATLSVRVAEVQRVA
jgi:hypothetical protein